MVHPHVLLGHAGVAEPTLCPGTACARITLLDRRAQRYQLVESVPQRTHIVRDYLGQRAPPGAKYGSSAHHCLYQGEPERLIPERGHPEARGTRQEIRLPLAIYRPDEPQTPAQA